MASTLTHRGFAVLPLAVGALLLAGCTAAPDNGGDNAANDAAAARFVTCLEDEGQTAKIIDGGQVGVLMPDAPGDDGSVMSSPGTTSDSGEGGPVGMVSVFMDEDGAWMASDSADSYPEEGGIRDAWTACELEVPEFEQPLPDISGADMQTFSVEDQIENSLAFAKCARENGYADFADPDDQGMIDLPLGITEDEFRSLLEACSEELGDFGIPISQESAESLDFDWIAVLGEFIDVNMGVAVPVEGGK